MSRIRDLVLQSTAAVVAAVMLAGCGGGDRADGEVVARAAPDANAAEPEPGDPAPSSSSAADVATQGAGQGPTSTAAGIVVDVAGAVRRPGVYRMQPGARVHEAIQAAGGARRGASLGALNRAAVLVDGQQVLVGSMATGNAGMDSNAAASASGGGAGAAAGGAKVNINSADVSGLDELPGIGPVTAEGIVANRREAGPFASLDDLDRVPGIGPATIESLRLVATT